jgi:hypothetical protein
MSGTDTLKRTLCFLACVTVAMSAMTRAWAAGLPDAARTATNPKVQEVIAAQDEATPGLMTKPEILGTAVGLGPDNNLALVVYADRDKPGVAEVVRAIPPRLRGVAVSIHMTDAFRALVKPAPVTTVSHTAKQKPPIQLGTSGGWGADLANGYCCGGTLGSLIQVSSGGKSTQYVLSNYHVLEADIVDGGNGIVAETGDPVIQPGLIDVRCNVGGAQSVATLTQISSLPDSNVDCAVAEVLPGMVRADGAILEIGTLSADTVAAYLKQPVKKSGRTTKLTRSTVSGLNATIRVTYDDECAGDVAFTKTFTGQIVVANRASKFIAGGDSGSLMVEDVATSPRAVGLLYAGSSTSAIANPIDDVLSFVGTELGGTATMVGN